MQRSVRAIAFLLPFLLCIALIAYSWLYYYRSPLIYDIEAYFEQIESGNVSNWWSVLYMYECRWIRDLLNLLPGIRTDGRAGMFSLSVIAACMLCASFYIILAICQRRGSRMQLLYSCALCATVPLLLYNGVDYNSSYIGNLDYPGTAFSAFAVALSFLYRAGMGRKQFILLSLAIALVMLHVVSFRKPFILFVPCMAFYALLSQSNAISLKSCAKLALATILISIGFFAASELSSSLPHQKKYPIQHMLMSDLKIASVIAGEPDYLRDVLMPKIQCELVTQPIGFQYGEYEFIGHNLIITDVPLSEDHQWHELCRAYVDYSVRHPMAMTEARLIKTVQFFTGNHVPMFMRKCVECLHPHVKASGLTYNTFYWPENTGSTMGNVRRHLCTVVWLAGFILPLSFAWRRRRLLLSAERGLAVRPVLFAGMYTLIAMASYVGIIVATIDFRYRIPAVVLAVISLVMWYDARAAANIALSPPVNERKKA